jgi:hypothetical protein
MLKVLKVRGLDRSTVIILSAKHGQSPQTPSALTRIPDSPIIAALDAAWATANPTATQPLVAFAVDDDAMLMCSTIGRKLPPTSPSTSCCTTRARGTISTAIPSHSAPLA